MRPYARDLRAEIRESRNGNSVENMVTPLWHTRICCWIISHHILVCSNGGDIVRHEVSAVQRMASPKMAALIMIRGIQQRINRKGSLT